MRLQIFLIACAISSMYAADLPRLAHEAHTKRSVLDLTPIATQQRVDIPTIFKQVLSLPGYAIVVKFSDEQHCGQCKLFASMFEQAAKKRMTLAGVPVLFVHVNATNNAQLLRSYGVNGVPSVQVFYHGVLIRALPSPLKGFEQFLDSIRPM